MAAKKFGSIMVQTTVNPVMTGLSNMDSTVNITFINQGTTSATVYLAYVTDISSMTSADWLIFGESIAPNTRLEMKGIAVEQNTMLVTKVQESSAIVNCIAYGFEEEIQ